MPHGVRPCECTVLDVRIDRQMGAFGGNPVAAASASSSHDRWRRNTPRRREPQRNSPPSRCLLEPDPRLDREVRGGCLRRQVPSRGPPAAVRGEDRGDGDRVSDADSDVLSNLL